MLNGPGSTAQGILALSSRSSREASRRRCTSGVVWQCRGNNRITPSPIQVIETGHPTDRIRMNPWCEIEADVGRMGSNPVLGTTTSTLVIDRLGKHRAQVAELVYAYV